MEIEVTEKMMWVLFVISGEYILVLAAVIADLVSGLRKARERGEMRSSRGLRRTVIKLARYYNALFALSVIDVMQIIGIAYLQAIEGLHSLPLFPAFTLLGAVGLALIELKSIFEKSEQKQREKYHEAMDTIIKVLREHDLTEISDFFKSLK